jgi:hypothetical protein
MMTDSYKKEDISIYDASIIRPDEHPKFDVGDVIVNEQSVFNVLGFNRTCLGLCYVLKGSGDKIGWLTEQVDAKYHLKPKTPSGKNKRFPYNCYKDRKGYVIPKSPVIKATPDIIEWLSTDDAVRFLFNDKPNTKILDKEWLSIGIGHSYAGNVYASVWPESQEDVDKYFVNNPYMKIFGEDYDGFMRYMRWVAKLGPRFTKQQLKRNV